MTPPLRLTVPLRCSAAHAFAVWTSDFGTWWPRSHSVTAAPDTAVHLEPRLGGRIYERAADGTEHDWGEVTGWDPPRRLGYTWHLRRDRADATDVEIVFVDTGDGGSRLEITHSGWDRLGADGPAWRDANRGGWGGLLPHFTAAADPVTHPEAHPTTTPGGS